MSEITKTGLVCRVPTLDLIMGWILGRKSGVCLERGKGGGPKKRMLSGQYNFLNKIVST